MELVSGSCSQGGGSRDPIIIYDGECRFCVAARDGIERLGGGDAARYIPYQSEEAKCLLGNAYKAGRPDMAFRVDRDGKVSSGLDAFIPLLPNLRGGGFLERLLRVSAFRRLAERLYRVVARNRYRWFGEARPRRSC